MDSVEILPHPPFSPNAALSDCSLFRSMGHFLCNQRLKTFDEMKEACLEIFWFKASRLVIWNRFGCWLIIGRILARMMDFILKNKFWCCSIKFCCFLSTAQVNQDILANLILKQILVKDLNKEDSSDMIIQLPKTVAF